MTRGRGQWEGAFPETNLPMEWTLCTHKVWPPLGDVSHLGTSFIEPLDIDSCNL